MSIFEIIKVIPALVAAIRAVEDAAQVPSAGSKKLDAVLGIMSALHDGADQVMPQLKSITSVFVTLFNSTNIFTSGGEK